MLILWESRAKEALKNLSQKDPGQLLILSAVQELTQQNQQSTLPSLSQRIQALGDFITRARRMRQKRKRMLTNSDPIWNKRMKLTHRIQTLKKRKAKRTTCQSKRAKNPDLRRNVIVPVPTMQHIYDFSTFSTIKSERS